MKESSNTELQKLNIGDRDRILDRLQEERDQLRKENDLLKRKLKGVGKTSNGKTALLCFLAFWSRHYQDRRFNRARVKFRPAV